MLPSFFCAIINKMKIHMDKGKLKVLIHNLELAVDSLKSEIYSDVDAYTNSKAFAELLTLTNLPAEPEKFAGVSVNPTKFPDPPPDASAGFQ